MIMEMNMETATIYYYHGLRVQGLGEIAGKFIMGAFGVIMWLIGVINYSLSPHDPPSAVRE